MVYNNFYRGRALIIAVGITILGTLLAASVVSATTIDFSEHTAITGDCNGDGGVYNTPDTLWISQGITISNAYYYDDARDPFPNKCGLSPNSNSLNPAVITFTVPIDSVTFDWWTIIDNEYIEVYDSYHNLITGIGPLTGNGTNTLAGPGIKYLEFHDSGGFVQISTLTFSETSNKCDRKKLDDDKKKLDDDKKKLDNDIKKKADSKTIANDKKKYDDHKKKYDDDDKNNKCNYDKKMY
jgi:hypothetical protein